jgi:competence protein CoiA
MKYALICGKKTEATKGAIGFCPGCGSELIAKCGEVKINHWSHKGKRTCDKWWENETDWHRSWKGKFPVDWQEVWHKADDGEKHVADVKTKQGWTIEFQHSYLNPEERRSRDVFYPSLVWVVDGMRRKTDLQQFQKALANSQVSNEKPLILRVNSPDECRLLKEWFDSPSLVLFDFQDVKETIDSTLWILLPGISSSRAYLMKISQNNFIEYHRDERFDKLVENTILPIRDNLASIIKQTEKAQEKLRRSRSSRSPIYGKKYNPRRRRRF